MHLMPLSCNLQIVKVVCMLHIFCHNNLKMSACSKPRVFQDSLCWILLAGLKWSYLSSKHPMSLLNSLIIVINTEKSDQPAFPPSPLKEPAPLYKMWRLETWTLWLVERCRFHLDIPKSPRMPCSQTSQLLAPLLTSEHRHILPDLNKDVTNRIPSPCIYTLLRNNAERQIEKLATIAEQQWSFK